MSHGATNSYKDKLIRVAMSKGCSVRQGEKFVNAMLAVIKRALYRGEEVEIPGGTIQKVSHDRPVTRKWRRTPTPKGKAVYKVHTYNKQKKDIKFKPDPNFQYPEDQT